MITCRSATRSGTGVQLQGVIFNGNVVEEADFEVIQLGDDLGAGEYNEIKISNPGAKYTSGLLEGPSDSADLEVVVRTNVDTEKAIMSFDADATTATTCN